MSQALGASHQHVASGTADVQGLTAKVYRRLCGVSVTEDAGTAAAAEVILRHGTSTGGSELTGIVLAANETKVFWFSDEGVSVPSGVFVDRVAGTTKLTLFYRDLAG